MIRLFMVSCLGCIVSVQLCRVVPLHEELYPIMCRLNDLRQICNVLDPGINTSEKTSER